MKKAYHRRQFIKTAALTGIGLGLSGQAFRLYGKSLPDKGKRVGIIGLDTSHSVAYTKALNAANPDPVLGGYQVVAAYPKGSSDIASSVERIPQYTEEVQKMGVRITDSIPALLDQVDVVLLETNDGRPHLEQALAVFKAGKPVFIDKPVAASLTDVIAIYELAARYKIPVFSASSLRFMSSAQDVAKGKVGNVLGADTYSPATLEKTHPDLFWYGIHGVEILYTVMGRGCRQVTRTHTEGTDMVVGTWADGRIGAFRGTRTGQHLYGGTAYGEKSNAVLGPFDGYMPLLVEIIRFFQTGKSPVPEEDTLELYTFMEAADESKRHNGAAVTLDKVRQHARKEAQKKIKALAAAV